MYWYLSFLRPPPVSASAGGSITITPQIANDLRTELYEVSTDVSYTWQSVEFDRADASTDSSAVGAELLGRWDPPMSTYKPINVPLPPKARAGDAWRLGLYVEFKREGARARGTGPSASLSSPGDAATVAGPSNRANDLLLDSTGVLGVWSEPIQITAASGQSQAAPASERAGQRSTKKAKREPGAKSYGSGAVNAFAHGNGNGKGKGKEVDSVPKQNRITREFVFDGPSPYQWSGLRSGLGSGSDADCGADEEGTVEPSLALASEDSKTSKDSDNLAPRPRLRLRIIEQTSFDLDKKVWDSGLALGAWLWRNLSLGLGVAPLGQGQRQGQGQSSVRKVGNDFGNFGTDDDNAAKDSAALVANVLRRSRGRVLELGSGTGLVGLVLQMALAALPARLAELDGKGSGDGDGGEIIATDLPIELMQENITLNIAPATARRSGEDARQLSGTTDPKVSVSMLDANEQSGNGLPKPEDEPARVRVQTIHARVLDWDEPLPDWISGGITIPEGVALGAGTEGSQSWPDLIVAADVTYNTSSFPSLLKTLVALLKPSDSGSLTSPGLPAAGASASERARPLLLLAYKERDPAERDLWGMLRDRGIEMVLVDKVQGAEADRGETEIWVGRYVG